MNEKNIKSIYDVLTGTDESELPLTYAYIDDDSVCRVAMFGDEEEMTVMALSVLLEVFMELADGVRIEDFAESVKQELIRFNWEQGTEE